MNGLDPGDMSPEDWIEYYEEQQPPSANELAFEAMLLRDQIKDHGDEDDPPRLGELVTALYPDVPQDKADVFAEVLNMIAETHSWEEDEDAR
jgi:hypothetical protein